MKITDETTEHVYKVRVKGKNGKIYTYEYKIRRPKRIAEGELRISKSGRKYRNYYKKKLNHENSFELNKRLLVNGIRHCQICGKEGKLVAHHLDEKGISKVKEPDNKLSNLLLLCQSCHMRLHCQTAERNKDIEYLRNLGYSYRMIGELFGISGHRVYQLWRV